MFKKIMVLLAFLPFLSPAAELLWQLDLSSPEVQKIVAQCPYAKIAKDFEKTDGLEPETLKRLRIEKNKGKGGRRPMPNRYQNGR